MNILKSNKGFTLIEMLLALALMGIVSVAMAAVLVTGIRIINNSAKVINNTNTAAGQIDNWYADNNVNSTASGNFRVNFSNKGTYIYEDGQYITGKDSVSSAVVKAFEPNNTIYEPATEEIICKNTLTVNANLSASTYMQIYTKYTTVLSGKTVAAPSPSYLYTLTTPYPSGYNETIFRSHNFRFPYTPLPVTANTTYVNYSGANISFDVTNEDKYYYVNNFVVSQDGIITVTNNSTTGKKRSVFIYIKGSFMINSVKQLQVNITGSNSNYTSVFFVYSGNESIYLDGNVASGAAPSNGISCNTSGCFIYAPSSDISLIATGITGVLGANININGNSTIFPITASSAKPNWKDLVLKLIGS